MLLRVIGRGSYAKVFVVEQKSTRRAYAMKVIKKELVNDDEVLLNLALSLTPIVTTSASLNKSAPNSDQISAKVASHHPFLVCVSVFVCFGVFLCLWCVGYRLDADGEVRI